MARPLVTIISPTYNQERFVAECVESALAQTYAKWEQVFVDDGSSDRTRDIIASYRDPRVRLICRSHRGLNALAESYNAALAVSTGSLVGILEGDDRWPPDKLELQVPLFDDPHTVLSWGRATTIDEQGRPEGERTTIHTRRQSAQLTTAAAFKRLTRSNLFAPAVTVMVRRETLNAVGGFSQGGSALFADLPTWLAVTAAVDGRVSFLDRILGIYRVHATQTTRVVGAEMNRQHMHTVLHALAMLDQVAEKRLDDIDHLRRGTIARGKMAEGAYLLAAGQYSEAMSVYRDAFGESVDLPDRLFTLGGMVSSLLRTDLVSRALTLREMVRRQLRHD